MTRVRANVRGHCPDGRDRRRRRLQRREIEGRSNDQDPAGVVFLRVGHQPPPRQGSVPSPRLTLGNLGDGVEHAVDFDARAIGLDRLGGGEVEHFRKAPQARIGPQRAEEGLRFGKTIAKGVELVEIQEQETVAAEKRVTGGIEHVAEQVRPVA